MVAAFKTTALTFGALLWGCGIATNDTVSPIDECGAPEEGLLRFAENAACDEAQAGAELCQNGKWVAEEGCHERCSDEPNLRGASDIPCEDGERVRGTFCHRGLVQVTSECVVDSACLMGEQRETGALCKESWSNPEVQYCHRGVWQEPQCLCGASEPDERELDARFPELVTSQADLNLMRGAQYLDWLQIEGADEGWDWSPLSELRCVHVLRFGAEMNAPPQLPSMVSVGHLSFLSSSPIEDLRGFESLQMAQSINIELLFALRSLRGLGNLRKLIFLRIQNTNLTSLEGLENLESAYSIEIEGNPSLQTTRGLGRLQLISVSGFGFIEDPPQEHLVIRDNPQLQEVAGFDALEEISGDFLVQGNTSLTIIEPPPLTRVGGDLHVQDNPELDACTAEALLNLPELEVGGTATQTGNLDTGLCE